MTSSYVFLILTLVVALGQNMVMSSASSNMHLGTYDQIVRVHIVERIDMLLQIEQEQSEKLVPS